MLQRVQVSTLALFALEQVFFICQELFLQKSDFFVDF